MDAFYFKLTGEDITDEDYQHAQTVLNKFNIETMKDYHNLYNLSDVLLLVDILKNLGVFAWIIIDWIQLAISVYQVLLRILP